MSLPSTLTVVAASPPAWNRPVVPQSIPVIYSVATGIVSGTAKDLSRVSVLCYAFRHLIWAEWVL
jgi:hypothetical protein